MHIYKFRVYLTSSTTFFADFLFYSSLFWTLLLFSFVFQQYHHFLFRFKSFTTSFFIPHSYPMWNVNTACFLQNIFLQNSVSINIYSHQVSIMSFHLPVHQVTVHITTCHDHLNKPIFLYSPTLKSKNV